MPVETVRTLAEGIMADVIEDLAALVRIPSCAFPGFPAEPVLATAEAIVDLLDRYGVPGARLLDVPGGYPAVFAEIAPPLGAPTILLYAHYDIQPALMEGEEETGSNLETLIAANPSLVRCNAFVINDGGNMKAGELELTAALRGIAACDVTVRTLKGMAHSGSYGGAAPDALMALIRILDNLLDEHGDVAIPGLTRFEWEGGGIPEDDYRAAAGVLPGVGLMGTGTLASRLWAKPSVTAIGLDAPPTEGASNSLIPEAKARVSLRTAPGSDPEESVRLLMEHLHASAPWGVEVITAPVHTGDAFLGKTNGPVFAAAREAAAEAFDTEPKVTGSGGTIPLLTTLQRLAPHAEFVVWGPGDERSQVHAANESLDLGELERMIVAETLLLEKLGESRA